MTGQRRLAADRLPRPRRRAVLRRHLLPARAAPRPAELPRRCWRRSPAPGATQRERDRAGRRARSASRSARSAGRAARRSRRSTERCSTRAVERLLAQASTRRTAASGARPSSRRATALEFLLAARRARRRALERAHTLDEMAARRDLRPARRRLRPLLGRRELARAALREDALRQRAAGPRLPARLAGDRRASAGCGSARETLDWALREMRGPEGGFYSALDADSEGEEGRFYVWDEDEMREALGEAGIAADAVERVLGYWGVSAAGNFEGKNILHVPLRRERKAAARARRCPDRPLRLARRPRPSRPRRQADLLLERPDDRRARRRRGRARTPGLPRCRLGMRSVHLGVDAGLRGAPAPHLEGRRGTAERLPRGSRVPGGGAAPPLRGDAARCAGSTRPARRPTR